jgi:hypothetical protein
MKNYNYYIKNYYNKKNAIDSMELMVFDVGPSEKCLDSIEFSYLKKEYTAARDDAMRYGATLQDFQDISLPRTLKQKNRGITPITIPMVISKIDLKRTVEINRRKIRRIEEIFS